MDEHRHFIINKPQYYLSQFINNQGTRKNKKLLGELHDFPEGTMAIGRLDEHTEGLLFLTTDGKVSEQVRSKKVEKEYYAQVDGDIDSEALDKLRNGVEITVNGKPYLTLPSKINKLSTIPDFAPPAKKIRDERHGPTCWVSITISEGKFRQVRKMTAAIGFATLRLIRIRIGKTKLGNLELGGVMEVDKFDV